MRYMRKLPFIALAAALSLSSVFVSTSVRADEEEEEQTTEEAEEASEDDEYEDTDASAVVVFRDRLSPHGSWVDHGEFGTIWVPNSDAVGPDFQPYSSAGRWELTEDGDWLWVSDYDWGYIPFHYGRWIWAGEGVGWGWIPGRRYAPAWVTWRVGADGFIGWAPLPPRYYWVGGSYFWFSSPYPAAFMFCPTANVFHHHVHTVVIRDRARVQQAASSTHRYEAQPTINGNGRHAASPTLEQAGVPKSGAPKNIAKHDPRAMELAKKSSSASRGAGSNQQKSLMASESRGPKSSSFVSPRVRQEEAKSRASAPARSSTSSRSSSSLSMGGDDSEVRAPKSNRRAGESSSNAAETASRTSNQAGETTGTRVVTKKTRAPRPSTTSALQAASGPPSASTRSPGPAPSGLCVLFSF